MHADAGGDRAGIPPFPAGDSVLLWQKLEVALHARVDDYAAMIAGRDDSSAGGLGGLPWPQVGPKPRSAPPARPPRARRPSHLLRWSVRRGTLAHRRQTERGPARLREPAIGRCSTHVFRNLAKQENRCSRSAATRLLSKAEHVDTEVTSPTTRSSGGRPQTIGYPKRRDAEEKRRRFEAKAEGGEWHAWAARIWRRTSESRRVLRWGWTSGCRAPTPTESAHGDTDYSPSTNPPKVGPLQRGLIAAVPLFAGPDLFSCGRNGRLGYGGGQTSRSTTTARSCSSRRTQRSGRRKAARKAAERLAKPSKLSRTALHKGRSKDLSEQTATCEKRDDLSPRRVSVTTKSGQFHQWPALSESIEMSWRI